MWFINIILGYLFTLENLEHYEVLVSAVKIYNILLVTFRFNYDLIFILIFSESCVIGYNNKI